MRVDKEFMEKAKEAGLPLFRVQVDWRFVTKDKRPLKAHECAGYTTLETAAKLLELSWKELQRSVSDQSEK